jgi:hypothetical protein
MMASLLCVVKSSSISPTAKADARNVKSRADKTPITMWIRYGIDKQSAYMASGVLGRHVQLVFI